MRLTRRFFLKSSGIALVGWGVVPRFLARAAAATAGKGKILVVILQRGAADGLNIVVPHAEKTYYDLRPSIAIPRPKSGDAQAALDLDGSFGFHPALEAFKKLYDEKLLGVVHAAGSPPSPPRGGASKSPRAESPRGAAPAAAPPAPPRPHSAPRAFMEPGTPGLKSTP